MSAKDNRTGSNASGNINTNTKVSKKRTRLGPLTTLNDNACSIPRENNNSHSNNSNKNTKNEIKDQNRKHNHMNEHKQQTINKHKNNNGRDGKLMSHGDAKDYLSNRSFCPLIFESLVQEDMLSYRTAEYFRQRQRERDIKHYINSNNYNYNRINHKQNRDQNRNPIHHIGIATVRPQRYENNNSNSAQQHQAYRNNNESTLDSLKMLADYQNAKLKGQRDKRSRSAGSLDSSF